MGRIGKAQGVMLAVAVAMPLVFTAAVFAAPEEGAEGGPRMGKRGQDLEFLGLSAEQKARIEKEHEGNRQKWQDLKEKQKAKRQELKQELEKTAVDKAKVQALTGEIKELTGQEIDLRTSNILSMKEILTPEQFKQLQERRDKHGPRGPKGARGADEPQGPPPPPQE